MPPCRRDVQPISAIALAVLLLAVVVVLVRSLLLFVLFLALLGLGGRLLALRGRLCGGLGARLARGLRTRLARGLALRIAATATRVLRVALLRLAGLRGGLLALSLALRRLAVALTGLARLVRLLLALGLALQGLAVALAGLTRLRLRLRVLAWLRLAVDLRGRARRLVEFGSALALARMERGTQSMLRSSSMMAPLIRVMAYVSNLMARSGSNFSMASISPKTPEETKSACSTLAGRPTLTRPATYFTSGE